MAEYSMRLFVTVLLLTMLVLASENMGQMRIVACPQHNKYSFKVRCKRDKDCKSICGKKGLAGGHCAAGGRICTCIKRCKESLVTTNTFSRCGVRAIRIMNPSVEKKDLLATTARQVAEFVCVSSNVKNHLCKTNVFEDGSS
ncbi:hypothetical protein HAX54_007355 [Datura stramonium]|uniref:Uncharacterized protein n=1 Tax=Datura stramonium TaxID=4076 RepID=A0ABS8TBM5_DATST|nr:hypothetical protein [Datura stramonium]